MSALRHLVYVPTGPTSGDAYGPFDSPERAAAWATRRFPQRPWHYIRTVQAVTEPAPLSGDRSEFIVAATAAAVTDRPPGVCPEPDDGEHPTRDGTCLLCGAVGEKVLHSMAGVFGADWTLTAVIAAIESATEVRWVNSVTAHHLLVVEPGGGRITFRVPLPVGVAP